MLRKAGAGKWGKRERNCKTLLWSLTVHAEFVQWFDHTVLMIGGMLVTEASIMEACWHWIETVARCDLDQNTLIWCFSGDSFHYLPLCLLIFVLLHVTLHAACLCPLPSTTEEVSCEFGSSKYYALCGFGGILSCGLTHTAVVPLDLVKCRLQVCMEAEPPSSQHLRQPLKPSTNEYVSKEPTNYCIF